MADWSAHQLVPAEARPHNTRLQFSTPCGTQREDGHEQTHKHATTECLDGDGFITNANAPTDLEETLSAVSTVHKEHNHSDRRLMRRED
ncbi:hypothetical protein GOODEAATRI_013693 [Goodea atripinnis]|uniref:Uncharacterized protein n=1 Tax=Goodea atripinnis TaxID=208336 RepID=A0ABV0PXT9_9TELE